MYSRLTELILRWLRVPSAPHPPHGDPASLRVFQAGKNYLYLRLAKWGLAQIGALIGILFWFGVFADLDRKVEQRRAATAEAAAAAVAAPASTPDTGDAAAPIAEENKPARAKPSRQRYVFGPVQGFKLGQSATAEALARMPPGAMFVIWLLEIGGFALYVIQLPVTFLIARLDFELRWYMVTDRSLRLRHGIWKISESTMSFANIQQVVVSQGPVQRLLGLSDVRVQSAGGGSGGGDNSDDAKDEDAHLGLFHCVTNATEIRELILSRLRQYRESGLGDPDEKVKPSDAVSESSAADVLLAARELASAARALRARAG